MKPNPRKVPTRVWVVGALALAWNLIGVAAFVMQMLMPAEALQAMPPEQRALYEAAASWLYLFYALATFGGVLGAVGLLLRRRWAKTVFLLAFVGLLGHVIFGYATTPAWTANGIAGLGFSLFLIVIALVLWLFASRMAARGVLR